MIFGGLEFIILGALFGAAVIVVSFLTFPAMREWFYSGEGVLTEGEARNVEDVIRVSMKGRNENEYVRAVYDPVTGKVIKKSIIRGESVSSDVKNAHEDNKIIEY